MDNEPLFVARETIKGLPRAAIDTYKPLFKGVGNVFSTVGNAIDTAYGLPGRIFTGMNPAVPKQFSEQVGQVVGQTTKNPFLGALSGLAAGIAEPIGLPAKAPKVFKGFKDLTTKILTRLEGKSVTPKQEILDKLFIQKSVVE